MEEEEVVTNDTPAAQFNWKLFARRYLGALLPLIIATATFAPAVEFKSWVQVICMAIGFGLLGYWTKLKMASPYYQYIPNQRTDR